MLEKNWPNLNPIYVTYYSLSPTSSLYPPLPTKPMKLSLSLALFPMKSRSKARTRSVARSLRGSGSGSRDRKNPAQLLKLRDEKKEVRVVQDSLCPHGLGKKERRRNS
ncbi:hypothetical protein DVH24_036490 [Malus domestica]|uniref:Uncharacterized protein n=1 Tax=Malus domestica TaxID=3750 RepID=A0A498IGG7_MALDO|nr:hypothetical protein DVH24_036490 [Malus domestica]